MAESTVYKWRLSSDLKEDLEEEARKQETDLADLLDGISRDWLARTREPVDEQEEERLRAVGLRFAGCISGGDPGRAEEARERIRKRLVQRHASTQNAG